MNIFNMLNTNSHHYPFGSPLPTRTYQSGEYRYGFNGKEQDNDMGNTAGAVYDYGFRIYDSRIAKFTSVDPLTADYPSLTPYQFASNTPIQAIDLDGLEAYFFHGTFTDNKTWSVLEKANWRDVTWATGNNSATVVKAKWDGKNLHSSREAAALAWANEIKHSREKNSSEPLTLVGQSHGGNVAILVANLLAEEGIMVDYLITINTPSRTAENSEHFYILSAKAREKTRHFHIAHEGDAVAGDYGGDASMAFTGKAYTMWKHPSELFKPGTTTPVMGLRDNSGNGFSKRINQVLSWSGEHGPANLLFDYAEGYKLQQLMLPNPEEGNKATTFTFGLLSTKTVSIITDRFHETHKNPSLWNQWLMDAINGTKKTEFINLNIGDVKLEQDNIPSN